MSTKWIALALLINSGLNGAEMPKNLIGKYTNPGEQSTCQQQYGRNEKNGRLNYRFLL
jgi:hypothetical protein